MDIQKTIEKTTLDGRNVSISFPDIEVEDIESNVGLGGFIDFLYGKRITVSVDGISDYPEIYFFSKEELEPAKKEFDEWFSDEEAWEEVPKISGGVPVAELTETGNYFIIMEEDNSVYYFDHDDISECEAKISVGFRGFVKALLDPNMNLIAKIYDFEF